MFWSKPSFWQMVVKLAKANPAKATALGTAIFGGGTVTGIWFTRWVGRVANGFTGGVEDLAKEAKAEFQQEIKRQEAARLHDSDQKPAEVVMGTRLTANPEPPAQFVPVLTPTPAPVRDEAAFDKAVASAVAAELAKRERIEREAEKARIEREAARAKREAEAKRIRLQRERLEAQGQKIERLEALVERLANAQLAALPVPEAAPEAAPEAKPALNEEAAEIVQVTEGILNATVEAVEKMQSA
jgi:hypothetical protein